ncbi:MAG: CBS domain-containing protein [Sphingobacteriales bacterium]|jgi:CBS domain-containing protein
MTVKVKNILQNRGGSKLHAVSPNISVYEAIKVMGEHNIGSVLVMDGETLAGILTERDYARKVVLHDKSSKDTMVSEIMTPADRLITVTEDSTIEECMQKMSGRKIRHLPVLRDGVPVTVISIGDVVSTIIEEQQFTIKEMSNYIRGVGV